MRGCWSLNAYHSGARFIVRGLCKARGAILLHDIELYERVHALFAVAPGLGAKCFVPEVRVAVSCADGWDW